MDTTQLAITYIGGPTALLEFEGVRLLTDPTFDRAGSEYKSGPAILRKLSGPAMSAEALGRIDYVLLSHDHHFDNLDHSGRTALGNAKAVVTTPEGALRLGGNRLGLKHWESTDLAAPDGRLLTVVATPARHGPEGLDRGPVNGFVLYFQDRPERLIYVSGDTVWYDGVAEVARRFPVQVAILNLGAARVPEVGSFHLTMTADEAVQAARAFAHAVIIPVHFEDWAHFSEGREDIARTFANAGLEHRVQWPKRGGTIEIRLPLAIAS